MSNAFIFFGVVAIINLFLSIYAGTFASYLSGLLLGAVIVAIYLL